MAEISEKAVSVLAETPLFRGCTPAQAKAMMGCLGPYARTFRKGSYVLRRGDAVSALGVVVSGSVLVKREDYWGNSNILSRSGPGSLFAEAFACMPKTVSTVDVVADEKSEVVFLDVRRVVSLCSSACAHHVSLIRNLTAVLAQRNYALTQKMDHLTKRTTREKVLSYLSAQSQLAGSAHFDIPFNRQQLADYLSVDRSALSTCLGDLAREGVIGFSKNHFELR